MTAWPRPFHAALWVLLAVSSAAAAVQWVLIRETGHPYWWLAGCYALVGWTQIAVGIALWTRRPANHTGLLLVVVGLLVLVANLGNLPSAGMSLAALAAETPIAALLHLVLAFPSGRLGHRLPRALVVLGYASSVGWEIPMYVFGATPPAMSWLTAGPNPGIVRWADDLQSVTTGVALIVGALYLAARWRSSAAVVERPVMAMVYGYGLFTLTSFPLSARLLQPLLGWSTITLFEVQLFVILGVPFVFAAAMASGALARTLEVDELAVWLGGHPASRPTARDALAGALGDPTLELLHRLDDGVTLVDSGGRAAGPDPVGAGRGVLAIPVSSGEALIVYDPVVLPDPGLVHQAGRVAALAIDHERLTADLIATREEVRASRRRILEHGEQERRSLARDLHDGVQGRLVAAAMIAGQMASTLDGPAADAADELRRHLDDVITDVRHLVHGMAPPVLVERGLYAAVAELAGRTPLPVELEVEGDDGDLPWPVSAAGYFIVAEACANAVKHAGATSVVVDLTVDGNGLWLDVSDDGRGGAAAVAHGGLQGVGDRVAALNGVHRLHSQPGHGTRLEVRLPCGW